MFIIYADCQLIEGSGLTKLNKNKPNEVMNTEGKNKSDDIHERKSRPNLTTFTVASSASSLTVLGVEIQKKQVVEDMW